MITTEEARLRVGVDSSKVGPAMAGVGNTVHSSLERSMKKSLKSLNRLMTFNLTGMVLGMAKDLIPTAEEFWDKVYGVDEKADARLAGQVDKLKSLRAEVKAAVAEVAKAKRDALFEDSDAAAKAVILEKEGADMMKKSAALLDEYYNNLRKLAELRKAVRQPGPEPEFFGEPGIPGLPEPLSSRRETALSKEKRAAFDKTKGAARSRMLETVEANAKITAEYQTNEAAMIKKGRELIKVREKIPVPESQDEDVRSVPMAGVRVDKRYDASIAARARMLEMYKPLGWKPDDPSAAFSEALDASVVRVRITSVDE